MSIVAAFDAAARFHSLAAVAAKHGGFWITPGPDNSVALEIARATGAPVEDVHKALVLVCRESWQDFPNWYETALRVRSATIIASWRYGVSPYRWDAGLIARAACRQCQ